MDEWELIDVFLRERRDFTKDQPTTRDSYAHTLHTLRDWAEDRGLASLSVNDLQDFVDRPRREAGGGTKEPADNTVRRETTTVRAFFKWLANTDEVIMSPLFRRQLEGWKPGTVSVRSPNPISDETWNTLWHSQLGDNDRLWLGLAYFLGFRKYEFVTVRPSDWGVFDEGVVSFQRKGKRGTRHRLAWKDWINVELRPHLPWLTDSIDHWLVVLREYVKLRQDCKYLNPRTEDRVVEGRRGRPLDEPTTYSLTYYNKHLAALCFQAGLPRDAAGPHRLRHSAATNLYRAGTLFERMASLMNHSDMEMTRRYADVSAEYTEFRKRHLHTPRMTE